MMMRSLSIKDLPFTKKTKDYVLPFKLHLEQWTVPEGVKVRLLETTNFGWVVLPENCKDVNGFRIPKRIFKY